MFFGGSPFEHFAHEHGGGGGGRRGRGRGGGGPSNVDTTKLYETLGVSRHGVVRDMNDHRLRL